MTKKPKKTSTKKPHNLLLKKYLHFLICQHIIQAFKKDLIFLGRQMSPEIFSVYSKPAFES